jgi:external thioesterase TEII
MQDKTQLFLLHFAGGNCYSFQFLKKQMEQEFEFCPLELPGRGRRMNEALLDSKQDAVSDYVRQIKSARTAQPFVIYGHSMGASLGLEVAAELAQAGDAPLAMIVSGNAGPGMGEKKERYLLPDSEFKTELRELGGAPEEVLENEELFSFFAPILRADFQILETGALVRPEETLLNVPITALMGAKEETSVDIENWKRFSSASVRTQVLEGNHFFIYDHPSAIVEAIKNANDRALVR